MPTMHYEKLQVWQRAINLARLVHIELKSFPKHELYGLTKQMREASVSIPSNIAEGSQRTSNKEFAHFILIAKGSLAELDTQVILAHSFEYLSTERMNVLRKEIDELSRMLHSFHSKLVTRNS